MRYRFVFQLDAAEDADPDFSGLYDIQTTEIHTRPGLPGASSVGPNNTEVYTPILSALFAEVESLLAARLAALDIAPAPACSDATTPADRASPGSIKE